MRRPSFQFYPSDWRNDAGLKLCSMGARGLWIEMICIMHASEPYGHLCAAGRPLDARDLAKLVGESEKDVKRWLDELARNNVFSTGEEGIFSRRMVRDEVIRDKRAAGGEAGSEFGYLGAEHGKKGGRPRKETGVKNPPSKPPFQPPIEPPPSSSSSSSSSNTTPLPPSRKGEETDADRFAEFWACWPKNDRKQDRAKCSAKWAKEKLDSVSAKIVADVEAKKRTQKWREGFVEAPLVYLNNRRWEDGEAASAPDWWMSAGFETVWQAQNAGCNARNAHQFREGKLVEVAA